MYGLFVRVYHEGPQDSIFIEWCSSEALLSAYTLVSRQDPRTLSEILAQSSWRPGTFKFPLKELPAGGGGRDAREIAEIRKCGGKFISFLRFQTFFNL